MPVLRPLTLLATCVVAAALTAAPVSADPDSETGTDPAPVAAGSPTDAVPADGAAASTDSGPTDEAAPPEVPELVESSPPATLKTPDGWTLTMVAKDETQMVIHPLTTAISTREYEVGGTFTGDLAGPNGDEDADPRGTLEVGYQIGCGIDMSTSNGVVMSGSLGFTPGLGIAGLGTGVLTGVPTLLSPLSGTVAVALKPGIINYVPVTKKEFKGAKPWVMIQGFRVKIDGCVGESFIRSYAYLTRSTDVSDAILAYYGVTKQV